MQFPPVLQVILFLSKAKLSLSPLLLADAVPL